MIFTISCTTRNTEKLKDIAIKLKIDSTKYAISLYDISKAINFEEIPKTIPYDSFQTKEYADLILMGSFVVFKPYYIPIEKITWAENPKNQNIRGMIML